ncbi:Type 1 glutamine amidotransferase-like domain-containing protein [Moraxella nasovis]|uniref:Type 1 glutamine amidotransferase-like domain-containing protein n=1 Tax=Moraxella nasovis TaxID=2904121 RepID=UPI00211237F9|nr:Type 1 glutamine amidotransferase-like domain-containing protein [Moraxella nasovis]
MFFLIEWIGQGKPYIGESAGSAILAQDIKYILPLENEVERFDDFVGLGVIDFYPLVHFGDKPFDEATKTIFDNYSSKDKMIALNNRQALIIYDNKMLIPS